MKQIDKAVIADNALRQLREELIVEQRNSKLCDTIGDFLAKATDKTKARLFELVTAHDTPADAAAELERERP
jgi:hypothetical protein